MELKPASSSDTTWTPCFSCSSCSSFVKCAVLLHGASHSWFKRKHLSTNYARNTYVYTYNLYMYIHQYESWFLWAMKGTNAQVTYTHCYKRRCDTSCMYICIVEARFSHFIVSSTPNADINIDIVVDIDIYIYTYMRLGMQTWQGRCCSQLWFPVSEMKPSSYIHSLWFTSCEN